MGAQKLPIEITATVAGNSIPIVGGACAVKNNRDGAKDTSRAAYLVYCSRKSQQTEWQASRVKISAITGKKKPRLSINLMKTVRPTSRRACGTC